MRRFLECYEAQETIHLPLKLMRTSLRVIGALAVAAVFFLAGALTSGMRHWFQPIAQVVVKNGTERELSDVTFAFESAGIHSTSKLPPLSPKQSVTVRFFVAGEGGYSIEARLPNGSIISGGLGYIESGFSATETITDGGIKNVLSY